MRKNVCPPSNCTGCSACRNACPFSAISFEVDKLGFYHPVIGNLCKDCNLCQNVCPAISLVSLNLPLKTLAAVSLPNNCGSYSTSGGISTCLSSNFIKNGGIAYGVAFLAENQRFCFVRCTTQEDVKLCSGSKYIQADVNGIFSEVKSDLIAGKQVLFVGTPCQVAGLKSYLRIEYPSLFLVDIICHGVPSQKMFFESLPKNIDLKDAKRCLFRKGSKYQISLLDGQQKNLFSIDSFDSLFLEGFASGRTLRESCHTCHYATKYRPSDISLGDFWGLNSDSTLKKNNDRISLVLLNTKKGIQLFSTIKSAVVCEERNLSEAVSGNSQLRHPVPEGKLSKKFRSLYQAHSFRRSIVSSRNLRNKIKHLPIVRLYFKTKQ